MTSTFKPSAAVATLLSLGIVLVAAAVSMWPFFTHEALPFGSDWAWHAQWVQGFTDGLREGHLYPRWINESNRAFGAPTFVFYPPISYWLTGGISLLGAGLLDTFRIAFTVASLASGVAFYFSARPMASRAGAVLGAVLYMLLPYHILEVYQRFAYAEFVAFIWLPPIFYCGRRLALGEGGARTVVGLALSYAALIMTHLPVAFMAPFALGPYAAWIAWRRTSWKRLLPILAGLAASLAIAAVFVLPWLVEGKHVNLDWRMTGQWNGDWHVNFVYEQAPGRRPDPIKPLVAQSVTTQLILGAAAAGLLVARLKKTRGQMAAELEEGLVLAAIAAWTFFLQVSLSKPIWSLFPVLGDIQFPWRFGTLQVLVTSYLCALAVAPLAEPVAAPPPASKKKGKKGHKDEPAAPPPSPSWWTRPAIAIALVAAAAVPSLVVAVDFTNEKPWTFNEEAARVPAYAQRMTYEYIARGVDNYARFQDVRVDDARVWLRGDGRVGDVKWLAQSRRVEVDAQAPSTLRLRTFDHPGWRARVDGAPVEIASANSLRAIEVPVPAGHHVVDVELGPTWDRTAGAWITAAALLLCVGLVFFVRVRVRRAA